MTKLNKFSKKSIYIALLSTLMLMLFASVAMATIPTIDNISIVSNNADNTKAMNGDIITLTFTSDEPVTKLGNFKINGSNPDTFTNIGNVYTATHLVDSGDIVGQTATFQINVQNATGIYSLTVEQTTDDSSITIIEKQPRITNINMISDSAKGVTKAKNGDTITLTFTSDEAITKLSNFKINGSNPDIFTNIGDVYTATHLVDANDVVGSTATFQINVKNASGIYSPTIEKTTDGSFVSIVDEKPVITNISIISNNTDNTKAINGDIITLSFTSDEPITKLSNFKINGSNPNTFTNIGNNYTATHLVDAGDIVGGKVTFQINVKNVAGIYSQTIEQTTDGSSIIIIDAPIGLVGVAPTSLANNDGKITGTTTAMEYKLSTEPITWTPATATEIIGLAAGTYNVRYAAREGYNAGTATDVVVSPYVVPVISSGGGGDYNAPITTPISTPTVITTPIPVSNPTSITDITNSWAKSDIDFLVNKGIINGYSDGTFKPEQTITRGEFIALLVKASGLESSKDFTSLNKFDDFENVPDWAKSTVATAVYANILTGFNDNTLRLDSKITRVEIVVLMSKILNSENQTQPSFKDTNKIPSWASDAVSKVTATGIIKGYPDNTFKPENLATRAETATMIAIYFRQK